MIDNITFNSFEVNGYRAPLRSSACVKTSKGKNIYPSQGSSKVNEREVTKKSTGVKVGTAIATPFKLFFEGGAKVVNATRKVVGIPVKGALAAGGTALHVGYEVGKVPVALAYETAKTPVEITYKASTNLTRNILLKTGKEVVRGTYSLVQIPVKATYNIATAPVKAIFS